MNHIMKYLLIIKKMFYYYEKMFYLWEDLWEDVYIIDSKKYWEDFSK